MVFRPSITAEEVARLSLIDFPGEICVVESKGREFVRAIECLKNEEVIGFDTETKPCFIATEKRNPTAILQFSTHDTAFIFKLLQLGVPDKLVDILSSPSIKKVGVAVRNDVLGLEHYKRFEAKGFVDLQTIAPKFGVEEKSVRKMAAIVLGGRVSKSQQLSNWENSQLSEAQLHYAATDAWVCREMYVKFMGL